ncbi:MAG: glycosyltransferase [Bacteroidales bacterium]|nr:glycosyltransferase [Bacteroidales bacterium]
MEIIVVDQNTDGFFDEDLKQLLQEVIWIKLPQPNASKARNIGFKASKASHILFIDDDLVPEKDFCKKALITFNSFADIDCFTPLVYNDLGVQLEVEVIKRKKYCYTIKMKI